MSVSVTFDIVDMNQILFQLLLCFCLMKNTVNVRNILTPFVFLQNAYKCICSPRTDVVKEVPYIAMIDSLIQ